MVKELGGQKGEDFRMQKHVSRVCHHVDLLEINKNDRTQPGEGVNDVQYAHQRIWRRNRPRKKKRRALEKKKRFCASGRFAELPPQRLGKKKLTYLMIHGGSQNHRMTDAVKREANRGKGCEEKKKLLIQGLACRNCLTVTPCHQRGESIKSGGDVSSGKNGTGGVCEESEKTRC